MIENILIENMRIIEEVRRHTVDKYGKNAKYFIKTYGCQMNEHDSEHIALTLEKMGYSECDSEEEADFVLYNTCVIRENAENRFYGNLGWLKPIKEKRKDMVIAVCGCMMQREHIVKNLKEKYKFVDFAFGTHNIHDFPRLFKESLGLKKVLVDVWDDTKLIIDKIDYKRKHDHRALVNIMYGCNNFCTFCIVPHTRGREKSRSSNSILNEVKKLLNDGVKEIILLGQNVNSYKDPSKNNYSFTNLLEAINALEFNFRLRFMTPHPKDFPDELIDAISRLEKVPPYVHLPVQAGSNKVLKKMNRSYTREKYLDLCRKLKKAVPDIALSTDIIIGFPSEEEEDVDELIDLIREVDYDSAFTFIYSRRKGTPADKFRYQVPKEEKHKRFDRMLKVLNELIIKKNSTFMGRKMQVLVDNFQDGKANGRTPCNRIVNFEYPYDIEGEFIELEIIECKKFSLVGKAINER